MQEREEVIVNASGRGYWVYTCNERPQGKPMRTPRDVRDQDTDVAMSDQQAVLLFNESTACMLQASY